MTIQAQILELIKDLQKERGKAVLFISHDLAVVRYVSDVVAVMASDAVMANLYEGDERRRLLEEDRGGHIVELKSADEIYENPEHPYTRKLIAAIPAGSV